MTTHSNEILISGTVIDGQNAKPIAGVQVTNTESIVIRDSDGAYSIACTEKHTFVQISMPSGYDGDWFKYIDHQNSAAEINFSLEPSKIKDATKRCRFVQVTDTHLMTVEDNPVLPKQFGKNEICQAMIQKDMDHVLDVEAPDFVIATGDLTNVGSDAQLSRLKIILDGCKAPVFPCFGGHDGIPGDGEKIGSVKRWEKFIGPSYMSWNAGGRHFVFAVIEEGYLFDGYFDMHEAWLKADLAVNKEMEIVFTTHVPPTDKFLAFLAPYNITFYLYGHWHSNKVYNKNGMVVCCTPPLVYGGDERTPRSYRVIELHEDKTWDMDLISVVDTGKRESDGAKACDFLNEKWHMFLPHKINSTFLSLSQDEDGKDVICLPVSQPSRTDHQELMLLDAQTGEQCWRSDVPLDVHSPVTIVGNRLYSQNIPGQVSAHDLSDGRHLWTSNLSRFPQRFLYTSPVYGDGALYVGGKGGFTALDAQTGEQLWHNEIGTPHYYDTWASYASASIYKHLVVLYAQGRALHAFDRQTGKPVWTLDEPVENDFHFGQATPVVFEDVLITGTLSGELIAVDLNTGKIRYKKTCASKFVAGLSITGDVLQVAFADGRVGEWCSRSFDEHWSFELPQDATLGILDYVRGGSQGLIAPLRCQNKRVVFDLIDTVYLLDDQGKLLDQYNLNSPVVTQPVIKDNKLWLSCLNGRVSHFELNV